MMLITNSFVYFKLNRLNVILRKEDPERKDCIRYTRRIYDM